MVGSRDGHNEGLWEPSNPWDSSEDTLSSSVNVSQDDLLRARVKGWFMGDNLRGLDMRAYATVSEWCTATS